MAYTTFGFFLKHDDSIYVPTDHIRWIASSFRISLSIKIVRIKPAVWGGYSHFASWRRYPKFKSGTRFCRSIFRCKEVDIKLCWHPVKRIYYYYCNTLFSGSKVIIIIIIRFLFCDYNILIITKKTHLEFIMRYLFQSKKISNDQELIQSDPISCPQNQKGNN